MDFLRSMASLAVVTTLLTSCGGGDTGAKARDDTKTPSSTGSGPGSIVAVGADGTTVEFADLTVTCRDSEEEQPAARIVVATSGLNDQGAPIDVDVPALLITAAETDGLSVDLPHSETYGGEETFLIVFITKVGEENELSSATELADGTIEVVRASCDPTPQLELRIDGTLESETSDGTVTVKGHITAG